MHLLLVIDNWLCVNFIITIYLFTTLNRRMSKILQKWNYWFNYVSTEILNKNNVLNNVYSLLKYHGNRDKNFTKVCSFSPFSFCCTSIASIWSATKVAPGKTHYFQKA